MSEIEHVTKPSYDSSIDRAALAAAQRIEDLFYQHHPGGRTQLVARIQCVIIDLLAAEHEAFLKAIEVANRRTLE